MFGFVKKAAAEYAAKRIKEFLGDAVDINIEKADGSIHVKILEDSFTVKYNGIKVHFSR